MRLYRMKSASLYLLSGNKLCLTGEVTEAPMDHRWSIGNAVRTSEIKLLDLERMYAVTQNSIYHFDEFIPHIR